MVDRFSWDELIPENESQIAARFLVATWDKLVEYNLNEFKYTSHEPILTELLHIYLEKLRPNSGLTGFWVNESQKPHLTSKGGIKRNRMDISYLSNSTLPRLELTFEFKKLSTSSLSIYRGKEGMGRFIDGDYALNEPLAIMVGIIKNGNKTNVVNAIYKSLSTPSVYKTLKMNDYGSGQFVCRPSTTMASIAEFDTEHIRPLKKAPLGGSITISHFFLVCS